MRKKLIYILFLFLACFIQLGHSLFPHTHVKEHNHNGEHHHNHNNEEHSDEKGLTHFFCHLKHTSDIFSNSHIGEVIKIVKNVSSEVLVFEIPSNFTSIFTFCYKKEVVQNKELLIFISPHLHSLQFRGPPTLFS